MTEQGYVFGATEESFESERLALLEKLFDPATHQFIRGARSLDGARVLEVGAGRGGIARWLADQVGPSGHVLATDIDVRFLEELGHPQLEVHRHDIVTDPLEGPFDLIHGRLVLHHVFQHAKEVLDKLSRVLAPDGCVILEEPDTGTMWSADPDHPRAQHWNQLQVASAEGLCATGIMDSRFGRRLPELFRAAGLVDVRSIATYNIAAPGSDYARWNELTLISGRDGFASVPGVSLGDVDAAIEALRDSTFYVGEVSMVRAVGRRP